MNKIALIFGNGNYSEAPLRNPINDAESLRKKLEDLGFKCIAYTDAQIKLMEQGLAQFGSKLPESEVGLFFFAGHGMQIQGKNYLTAIDTNFENELDAKYSSLPLDKVIDVMESGSNRTSIIILDACRNNPYERRWRGGESLGLAPVYAPKGMIIAYATSPGQVAFDGEGDNGAFTSSLLRHISTQDITIEDLFKKVRNSLSSSTKGKQISWEHTSLMGDFYFNNSVLTDELVTEYSDSALADGAYRPSSTSSIREIIQSLKSHNWYKQNSAMKELNAIDLASCKKDGLFVLGRNIYQAACGGSHLAIDFLEHLDTRLQDLDGSVSFHLLNGILYEIYFDSQGRKRETGKTEMIDAAMSIADDEHFSTSFQFIRNALRPYFKELFYIPGTSKDIYIDVATIPVEDGKRAISGVFFEGDNILYEESGESYFDPNEDDFLISRNIDQVNEMLSQWLITPSFQMRINYVDFDNQGSQLLVPFRMKIQRFSK